jgi:quercetin dioxygenase-like cupin family protein
MDKSGKIWGQTSLIFHKNNVEIHRIEGIKGGKSSNHTHKSKISMMFVEKGCIAIYVEKNNYKLVDKTILTDGQSTIIMPEEYHYFEILEGGTICYEIYWVEINPEDIIRKDHGSLIN